MHRTSTDDDDLVELRPEDVCSAGGIHSFEREFTCGDCLCMVFCCPCCLVRETFCGWWSRNPGDDNLDGMGCAATGPNKCTKCKQTEEQTKSASALAQFQGYRASMRLSQMPQSLQPQGHLRQPSQQQQQQQRQHQYQHQYQQQQQQQQQQHQPQHQQQLQQQQRIQQMQQPNAEWLHGTRVMSANSPPPYMPTPQMLAPAHI